MRYAYMSNNIKNIIGIIIAVSTGIIFFLLVKNSINLYISEYNNVTVNNTKVIPISISDKLDIEPKDNIIKNLFSDGDLLKTNLSVGLDK